MSSDHSSKSKSEGWKLSLRCRGPTCICMTQSLFRGGLLLARYSRVLADVFVSVFSLDSEAFIINMQVHNAT